MQGRCYILRLVSICAAAALCCVGCSWLPKRGGDEPPKTAAADAKAAPVPGATAPVANGAAAAATPAELTAIMNEVQQMGVLDPAAQNALLEDLKKTDPSLWPQLMQTFRASVA